MGGAPSRETLVRGVVREPRGDAFGAQTATSNNSSNSIHHPHSNGGGAAGGAGGKPQQPEIVLIPLISEYFPNASSPIFQQLLAVRREPSVMYYTRDSRTSAGAGLGEDVMPESAGTDAELYNYYMNLSDQRVVETDNDLIALHRSGRAYTPVPCAVAFVYDPASAIPSLAGGNGEEAPSAAGGRCGKTGAIRGKDSRGHHKKHGPGGAGASGATGNGYMTLENTVRLTRQNLRIRIFGFVGDTRLSQPFMLPAFATKSPVGLGLFLSKSAGGNHRTQVTLLAAYTYVAQLRQAGVLAMEDFDLGKHQWQLGGGGSGTDMLGLGADAYASTMGSAYDAYDPMMMQNAHNVPSDAVGGGGRIVIGSSPSFGAFEDAYHSPTMADGAAPPSAYVGGGQSGHSSGTAPSSPTPGTGANGAADDAVANKYGDSISTNPHKPRAPYRSQQLSQDELQLFLHPVTFSMHRTDIPALCHLRELRFRMTESAAWQPAGTTPASSLSPSCCSLLQVDPAVIRTSLSDGTLRGYLSGPDAARLVLWGAEYYVARFSSLTGGEATKFRNLLAQRNLAENVIEGQVFVSVQDPATTAALSLRPADVWVTAEDTFLSCSTLAPADRQEFVRSAGGEDHKDPHGLLPPPPPPPPPPTDPPSSTRHHHGQNSDALHEAAAPAVEEWEGKWVPVPAGTVFRRTKDAQWSTHTISAHAAPAPSTAASEGSRVADLPCSAAKEYVEDILLTVCRAACNDSRRAPPTDPHWVVNPETCLPAGLLQGFVIWRDSFAGQSVFYGTTPDYLKKWLQAGHDPATEYKKYSAIQEASTHRQDTADATAHSKKLAVQRGRGTAGADVAGSSSGRNSLVAGTGSSNYSDSLLKQQQGSRDHSHSLATGSDPHVRSGSPISVYSVRTGFVRTPSDDERLKKGTMAVGVVGSGGAHSSRGSSAAAALPGSSMEAGRSSGHTADPARSHQLSSSGGVGSHGQTPPKAIPVGRWHGTGDERTVSEEVEKMGPSGSPGGKSVSISDIFYRASVARSGASTPMYSSSAILRGGSSERHGATGGLAVGSLPVRIGGGGIPSSSSSDAVATSFKQGGHSPSSATSHGNSLLRSASWAEAATEDAVATAGGPPHGMRGKEGRATHSQPQPLEQPSALSSSSAPVAVGAHRSSSLQVSNTKFSIGSSAFARSSAAAGHVVAPHSPPAQQHHHQQQQLLAASPPASGSQRQGTLLSCSFTSTNRKQVLSTSAAGNGSYTTLLGSSPRRDSTTTSIASSSGGDVRKFSVPQPQQPVMASPGVTPRETTAANMGSEPLMGHTSHAHAATTAPAALSKGTAETSAPVAIARRAAEAADASREGEAATPSSHASSSLRRKEQHRPPPLLFPIPSSPPPSPEAAPQAGPNAAAAHPTAPAAATAAVSSTPREMAPRAAPAPQPQAQSMERRGGGRSHHRLPEPQQPVRASPSVASSLTSQRSFHSPHSEHQHPRQTQPQPSRLHPPLSSSSSAIASMGADAAPHGSSHLNHTPTQRFSQREQPQPHYPYGNLLDRPASFFGDLLGSSGGASGIAHAISYHGTGPDTHTPHSHSLPPPHQWQPSTGGGGAHGSAKAHALLANPLQPQPQPQPQPQHPGCFSLGSSVSSPAALFSASQGGSVRIPIVRSGIDGGDQDDEHSSVDHHHHHPHQQPDTQGTPTQNGDGAFRPSSAKSSVGNGRYRWDWRATTPTLSSSFKSGSMK